MADVAGRLFSQVNIVEYDVCRMGQRIDQSQHGIDGNQHSINQNRHSINLNQHGIAQNHHSTDQNRRRIDQNEARIDQNQLNKAEILPRTVFRLIEDNRIKCYLFFVKITLKKKLMEDVVNSNNCESIVRMRRFKSFRILRDNIVKNVYPYFSAPEVSWPKEFDYFFRSLSEKGRIEALNIRANSLSVFMNRRVFNLFDDVSAEKHKIMTEINNFLKNNDVRTPTCYVYNYAKFFEQMKESESLSKFGDEKAWKNCWDDFICDAVPSATNRGTDHQFSVIYEDPRATLSSTGNIFGHFEPVYDTVVSNKCIKIDALADIEVLAEAWENVVLGLDPFEYKCTSFTIDGWATAIRENSSSPWSIIVEPAKSLREFKCISRLHGLDGEIYVRLLFNFRHNTGVVTDKYIYACIMVLLGCLNIVTIGDFCSHFSFYVSPIGPHEWYNVLFYFSYCPFFIQLILEYAGASTERDSNISHSRLSLLVHFSCLFVALFPILCMTVSQLKTMTYATWWHLVSTCLLQFMTNREIYSNSLRKRNWSDIFHLEQEKALLGDSFRHENRLLHYEYLLFRYRSHLLPKLFFHFVFIVLHCFLLCICLCLYDFNSIGSMYSGIWVYLYSHFFSWVYSCLRLWFFNAGEGIGLLVPSIGLKDIFYLLEDKQKEK